MTETPLTTRRVLIVEDQEDVRELERILARACDYTVVEAESAREALARLDENAIDVVLLDIGLPGVSGWVVLDRTAADGRPPVVLCTAWGRQPHVIERAREGGAVEVIDKTELVARLPEVLRALAS